MDKIKYFVTSAWAERLLAQWITTTMIAVHVGLGVVIVVGGSERFAPPSYQPLIDFTGDRVWIWGVIILLSAALMSTPFRWPNIIGLWIGMSWMILWMTLFAVATVNYPDAVSTAMVAYGGFAMINASLLTARVMDKCDEKE